MREASIFNKHYSESKRQRDRLQSLNETQNYRKKYLAEEQNMELNKAADRSFNEVKKLSLRI